ncbi:DUF58 domain-containing protein [Aquibacillus rhizosphaerae]|uniref:DUF58 domain-containing protein n=1 Tax=Aquibacillus rhizosphaerae TaxID=3051431 RepID=A0ABT7L8P5_9BACI|nr:DUF58 domain-containing protein [Aquibacillus sp. LR5S19]MDL4842238.1 DUF58 domain-containing protein [Aquibacillus sp. LR5S19]
MSIAWVIIVTCIVIFCQSFLYDRLGLKKILYSRTFSQSSVFEGENIEMVDEISNKKWLPLPWIRLESKIHRHLQFESKKKQDDELEETEFHRTLFSLRPYQKITRRHKITCVKRGYYALHTVSMSTGDVLGFNEKFKTVDSSATITVYPALVDVEAIPLPSHSWLGDITVRRWIIEDPFVIAGVREYADGDSLNTINWKATARSNRLQVSQKDYTADHYLMIYVNFDQTEDIWMPIENERLIEKALSFAASIANYTIANGISTGFGCNAYLKEPFSNPTERTKESVRLEPESGMDQIYFILDTIAKLKMDRSRNFNYFLLEDIENQVRNKDILLITSIVSDEMKSNIRQLEAMGNAVEIIMVDDESQVENSYEPSEVGGYYG